MKPISDFIPTASTCSDGIVGKVEALQETQDGTNDNDRIQSVKAVPGGSKSLSLGSNAELEAALNKFFGRPPFCLITPDCIESHTKLVAGKRACKGRVQLSRREYAIVTWLDVLSDTSPANQFQLQENGMYHCRVKERLVELSAENYHFIKMGYPQRMIQQEVDEMVGIQDVSPVSVIMDQSRNNPVPAPIDKTLTSPASDLSPHPDKSTTVSGESKKDIKGISQVTEEFQAETARHRSNSRRSDSHPRRKQGFSGWTPVLVADSPVRSADYPAKPDFPAHMNDGSINDGGTGSLDVAKQTQSEASGPGNTAKSPANPATPVRHKDAFIL
ncbi:hypothetical protein N7517_009342 [Penicillium concentricum]|uniref:Uncharacterized protein n=1 Tax=Penicillium concentricum TaxID=293559 RepID=A0A9W9RHC9_9EURO|nr:uncharacterized protein N7517_009342 [Penicillium concentricum]KAJ5360151.1 hypothetical protein N7517_009342 [Penicillium concentricum]